MKVKQIVKEEFAEVVEKVAMKYDGFSNLR